MNLFMRLKKLNSSIYPVDKSTMQLTKLESWLLLDIQILLVIKKPFTIRILSHYGKNILIFSIVMEYADGGDLLQKIFEHKKKGG